MNHSVVYNRRKEKDNIPNYAIGYVYSNQLKKLVVPDSLPQKKYVTYMDGITGDDGVSSNLIDMNIWMKASRNNSLLNSESIRLMTTPHILSNGVKTNYGFGFFIRKGVGIEDVIYHTGSWPGYSTATIELIESNVRIIILTNRDYDELTFLADEIIFNIIN